MRKNLAAMVGLTLLVAACGGSGETASPTPTESTTVAVSPADGASESPASSTLAAESSAAEPSDTPVETPAAGGDTFPVPADLGVPVESMPLMPGATAELGYRDIGQTWTITHPDSDAQEIKAWYEEKLAAEGFEVKKDGNIVSFRKPGLSGQIIGLQRNVVFEMRAEKS